MALTPESDPQSQSQSLGTDGWVKSGPGVHANQGSGSLS